MQRELRMARLLLGPAVLLLVAVQVTAGAGHVAETPKQADSAAVRASGLPWSHDVPAAAAVLSIGDGQGYQLEGDPLPRSQHQRSLQQAGCSEVVNVKLLLRWLRQAQFAGYLAANELGYYSEECLTVDIMDGAGVFGGVNISAASADVGIPWFLEFLESVEMGSNYLHISQIFQRPAWRYFGMPVQAQFDLSAVTKSTVRNFGDLRNGVRFGVPLADLDNGVKSLLLKYNKRFCGANDWRTGQFVECTGSEDIQFVLYGFNISNIPAMEIPFFQGMSYNELGALLLMTNRDGEFIYTTSSPTSANNIKVYAAYDVDGLHLPEDGLMIHASMVDTTPKRETVSRFIRASYRGWIHCRDNEKACVNLIAPNYGNLLQQMEHTLQTWQMREVNRGMWPAQLGIGVHNLTEMLEAARLGRDIGALTLDESEIDRVERSVVSEMFTLEAHNVLEARGIDIYGASWANKTGLRFCISEGSVIECPENISEGLARWKLAIVIAIPACLISGFLVILACHTCRLRQRLKELQDDPVAHTLDLEAPITKVRRLLRTVNELEGDRVTPELALEVRNMMDALQRAHDMNMPDLEQQLLKIDKNVYSSGLASFLVESIMQGEVKARNYATTPALSRDGSFSAPFTEASRKLLCIHPETASERDEEVQNEMDSVYNFVLTVHPEADEMLHKIGVDPFLDMLTFSSLGNSQLLITVTFHIFRTIHDLVLPLGINDRKLLNFMKSMEIGMRGPKFHNSCHAADTMSRLSAIVKMGGLYVYPSLAMKRELVAALLACIVEDYKHPGRTNVFHIKRQTDAALMFNQQHVNQNNSLQLCMARLRDPECNFIEAWSEEEQHEFRCSVIQLVLGSDMDLHFELLTRFQMKVNTETGGYNGALASKFFGSCDRRTRLLILQLAVACARHGDPLLPHEVHKKWVKLKEEEYFEQGDEELKLGLRVSGLSDRSQPGISDPRTQIGWLDIIVIPTFQQFCNVFMECEVLLQKCLENRSCWEADLDGAELARLAEDRAARRRSFAHPVISHAYEPRMAITDGLGRSRASSNSGPSRGGSFSHQSQLQNALMHSIRSGEVLKSSSREAKTKTPSDTSRELADCDTRFS